MARLWQQIMKSEQGQALPIVLILLVVGGLLIAPSLNYAATSLNAGRIIKQNLNGVYAADAGVEHALWRLKNDSPPSSPYYLPEPVVNQMQQVAITTDYLGSYTLYLGGLLELSTQQTQQDHYTFLTVNGEMEWIEEETYKYTITVTRRPEAAGEVIHLEKVGARLPVGFSYDSADIDGNLSREDPVDTLDGAGAHMLNWELGPPPPAVLQDEPATQEFYVTGAGEPEGDYAWVVADRPDIGTVSEFIGKLYSITAAATLPGEEDPIARIRADVLLYEATGEINIISWQINPQEND